MNGPRPATVAVRLARAAASIIAACVVFLLIGELGMRTVLSRQIFYDVEMARYSNDLKIPSASPLVIHEHRPGAAARLMGVEVRINADGLRDRDYPSEKGAAWRIAILGDSLTLGWGVEEGDTFTTLLEKRLATAGPTEVLNFGTGNYNTTQEVNLFLRKGAAYSPDQVVLFYFINDAEPLPQRSALWFLGRSRFLTFIWSRVIQLRHRLAPGADYRGYYADLYRPGAPGWLAAQESLRQLRDYCAGRGIVLQVVLLPELHRIDPYLFAEEHTRVGEALKRLDISWKDLAPGFSGVREPMKLWVAADDAHPNAAAHRRIAELAFDFIAAGRPVGR